MKCEEIRDDGSTYFVLLGFEDDYDSTYLVLAMYQYQVLVVLVVVSLPALAPVLKNGDLFLGIRGGVRLENN